MQSMNPTTAGSSTGNAATARSQGDEITVIASSVSPTEKKGQKAESSFSKSTGFSTQLKAAEDSEANADVSLEAESTHASLTLPHNLGQAQLPSVQGENTAEHGAQISQTLGQAQNTVSGSMATAALRELASGALQKQHSGISQQIANTVQTGTDTVSKMPLAQQIVSESSLATSFTNKLNEVLGTKSEQIGLSATNITASDLNHSAITQSQAPSQTSPTRAVWANVQMDASQGKWGEQMLQVLQDRVSLQATQNLQEARIRLDPPDLGKLDLVVRVDGDRLNVQINANHAAVRDALVQVSERLRAELQQQQFVHVDVNVGTGDQGQASYSQAQEDESYQPVIFGANDNFDDSTTDTTSEHWLSTTA